MSSEVCLVFKKEPWTSSCWNFMQIKTIILTSKNMIFHRNLFASSETFIGFVASKWVRKWSRILIPSLSWSYTQNEVKFNCQFHRLSLKMWLFANDFKHRQIIYGWKVFFITSMNLESLSQNKVSFGSDPHVKFVIFAQKYVPTVRALSTWTEDTILNKKLCWTWWHQGSLPKTAIDLR